MSEKQEISEIIESKNDLTDKDKKFSEALNKYFKLIVVFVVVTVLSAGYYFVIIPKLDLKSKKDQNLASLQSEVNKLKADSDFLSKYSSKIIEFTPDEDRRLSLALPNSFDLSSIIVQLSRLTSESKFILENIQVNEAAVSGVGDSKIKRVDIELAVSGLSGSDYGSFGKFVESLESSLMIFDVRAISFTPEDGGYKLELSTYYYPSK